MCAQPLSRVRLFLTTWTAQPAQTPLFIRFPRQDYRSGLQFPTPGALPAIGIGPGSCVSCTGRRIFITDPPGKPLEQNNPQAKIIHMSVWRGAILNPRNKNERPWLLLLPSWMYKLLTSLKWVPSIHLAPSMTSHRLEFLDLFSLPLKTSLKRCSLLILNR